MENSDKISEVLKLMQQLADNAEIARELIIKNMPKVMTRDEFLEKLQHCQNFRSQLFGEFRVYQTIKPMLDFDKLYAEYVDMKAEKVAILSQFVKGNILYISEKIGNRVHVSFREYDYEIVGDHNFPISEVHENLPTDEESLSYWRLVACLGCYTFEHSTEPVGKFITVTKLHSIKKDVFLFNDEIIVHVQDSDFKYDDEKEQKAMESFMEYMATIGPDKIETILNRIIGENPELVNNPK